MTDSNTLAPTDAELEALIRECRITVTDGQSAYEPWADLRPELTVFARAVLAKWGAQPAAVPAAGPVGFDHKTAANFLNGKTVTDEEMRRFVACSRWAHDDRDGLRNTVSDLRREIAQRDAEIALLKISLLAAEQPAQALDAWQPIETAPKDGEAVILTEDGKVFHGGFITIDFKEIRDSEGNFIDQIDPDAYWMNFDAGDVCTPTHWMPNRSLPMPPDAAIATKQGGAHG